MNKIGSINLVGFALIALIVTSCKSSAPATDVPDASLRETYWKLTELMGQPVPAPRPDTREVHLTLKNGNRLQGFAGCNNIMGSFEVKNEFSITFSGVVSTLMACPDMTTEDSLKKVLEQVDNYTIRGNSLSLSKARMAPLARFEAVYLK
jgi:heat shock protein HslJ